MKIISWNINGIRAVHKKGLLLPFFKKFNPDIVCFQETKAEQSQHDVDMKEYEEFWNSATRKGYSGTAVFTKEKPLSVAYNFPIEIFKKYKLSDEYGDTNTEGRVITVEYKNFYLVTSYTPNSKEDLSRIPLRHKAWDPAFLEYIENLDTQKPVIFCGDLNVAHTEDDLANPKQNEGKHGFTKEEREGIEKIIDKNFVDTFRIFTKGNGNYTWWSHFSASRERNVGWRIDYFFVSSRIKDKVKKALIHSDILGSDHCPIELEIDL